jgi:hypothetical protein
MAFEELLDLLKSLFLAMLRVTRNIHALKDLKAQRASPDEPASEAAELLVPGSPTISGTACMTSSLMPINRSEAYLSFSSLSYSTFRDANAAGYDSRNHR